MTQTEKTKRFRASMRVWTIRKMDENGLAYNVNLFKNYQTAIERVTRFPDPFRKVWAARQLLEGLNADDDAGCLDVPEYYELNFAIGQLIEDAREEINNLVLESEVF